MPDRLGEDELVEDGLVSTPHAGNGRSCAS